ncbi:hypothetical protein EON65_44150 [archaeon]|nr:MAG: hypothetical protein EON65_44150 [archaeon]
MAIIVPVQVHGKKMFWVATFLLALAVVTVFLMYLLEAGSAKGISNSHVKNFEKSEWEFFDHLPLAVAFYAGIDAMRTCTDTQSNHTVPKDMVICMCSAGVLALCLIVTASYLTDDKSVLSGMAFPLSEGFSKVLGVSLRHANWLSLPGAVAGSFAFTYAFGRQLRSMAGSGLLPAFLSTAHTEQKVGVEDAQQAAQFMNKEDNMQPSSGSRRESFMGSLKGSLNKANIAIKQSVPKKPASALLFGSCLSYGLLLLGYFALPEFEIHYLRVCVLLVVAVYSSLLTAYFVFMLRYSNLDRTFHSPFGLVGACISLFVFLIIFVCDSFFQSGERVYTVAVFVGMCAVYYAYYVCVARKRQFFSKEEQEKFMKAYVVNANANRKKNKKFGAGSSTGLVSGVLSVVPSWLKPAGSSSALFPAINLNRSQQHKSLSVATSAGGMKKSASQNSTVVPSGESVTSDVRHISAHVNVPVISASLMTTTIHNVPETFEGDLAALQRNMLDNNDSEQQIRNAEGVI